MAFAAPNRKFPHIQDILIGILFVAGEAAVDGLLEQIGQRKLGVPAAARVAQVALDEFSSGVVEGLNGEAKVTMR